MKRRLPLPALCLITDLDLCDGNPTELTRRVDLAIRGGVDVVQLRQKNIRGGKLLDLATKLQDTISDKALFLVNERIDVAMACGADGVQLGSGSLPIRLARPLLGHGSLIGASVHDCATACQAEADGTDFLLAGTIFPSDSHRGITPSGPNLISQMASVVQTPILGIGGINATNAPAVAANRTGAAQKSGLSAFAGIIISLEINFKPSAISCRIPSTFPQ